MNSLSNALLIALLAPYLVGTSVAFPQPQNITAAPSSNNLTPFPDHTQGDFTITGSVDLDSKLGGPFAEYVFVAFHHALARKPRGLRIRSAGHVAYVSDRFQVRAEGTWLQQPSPLYGDVWDAVDALFAWSSSAGSVVYRHAIDVIVRRGEEEIARVVLTLEHGNPLPIQSEGRLVLDGTVYPERRLPGGEKTVKNIFVQEAKRMSPATRIVSQHFDYHWDKDGTEMTIYFEIRSWEQREKYKYSNAELQLLVQAIQQWCVDNGSWSEIFGNIQDKTLGNEVIGRWHLGIKPYDLPVSNSGDTLEDLAATEASDTS